MIATELPLPPPQNPHPGEIEDWGQLNGSYRGGLDHAQALKNAGYTVVSLRGQS